jgi:hypothetical protein
MQSDIKDLQAAEAAAKKQEEEARSLLAKEQAKAEATLQV